MIQDSQDRVWFGTDHGVFKWNGQDLRNYTRLDGLLGNLSVLETSENLSNQEFERLTLVKDASKRAQNLTRQLLTFAMGGEPLLEKASLGSILRQSLEFALSGSNVSCNLDLPENLWPVVVDPGQIDQAFTNLLLNAAKAMAFLQKILLEFMTHIFPPKKWAVDWAWRLPIPSSAAMADTLQWNRMWASVLFSEFSCELNKRAKTTGTCGFLSMVVYDLLHFCINFSQMN